MADKSVTYDGYNAMQTDPQVYKKRFAEVAAQLSAMLLEGYETNKKADEREAEKRRRKAHIAITESVPEPSGD